MVALPIYLEQLVFQQCQQKGQIVVPKEEQFYNIIMYMCICINSQAAVQWNLSIVDTIGTG